MITKVKMALKVPSRLFAGALDEFAPLTRSTRATHRFMAHDAAYGENHAFAVAFTCVAAASQGLGGLLAVLGMGESLC